VSASEDGVDGDPIRAANDLEAANGAFLAFLDSLGEREWRAIDTSEGWPVAAVAYHVADGYRIHLRWLDLLRRGEPVPGTPGDLDAENARTAQDAMGLSPGVIRSAAETAGRMLVAAVRGLGPGEVEASAALGPLGGRKMTVGSLLEITAWHVRSHMRSMRLAVQSGRQGPGS
jgi:hypothetical protein